jgi:preprotein translocase subunit SecG
MYTIFATLHILAAVILIMVVLLQSGKAGDLASAFGTAGSQTAFGARGAATFLTKATTVCAVMFMISSLALAIMSIRATSSTVMEDAPYSEEAQPGPAEAPVTAPSEGSPATVPE